MSTILLPRVKPTVLYPASDGLPMSANTKQFRWIMTIQGGLDALYLEDDNVFVAGNLLWYPVEGNNNIRAAPDIFVAFGRPKGDRSSYLQWEEDNIAPQVTFEVLSPGNRTGDVTNKFKFYETYGVEEYYLWDPENADLRGWRRKGGELRPIPQIDGWTSPRLRIRFELVDGDLRLYGPDGKKFATYVELVQQREKLAQEREQERQAKEQALERAERLTAQLKALGIKPDA
jgi:Uma2 family endonuclease